MHSELKLLEDSSMPKFESEKSPLLSGKQDNINSYGTQSNTDSICVGRKNYTITKEYSKGKNPKNQKKLR